jgi:hypothetical protein
MLLADSDCVYIIRISGASRTMPLIQLRKVLRPKSPIFYLVDMRHDDFDG